MNTSAVPARGFFRRYALGMAFTGFLGGLMSGTFVATQQKPVFESRAVCRPIRPENEQSGVSSHDWLHTEAAIMGSQKNLEEVTRNLNLTSEWACSVDECVKRLKSSLEITVPPETELV